MRMKHFKANLIGLEEKDESVTFDLQSFTGGVALFVSRNKLKPTSLYQRDEFHYHLTP